MNTQSISFIILSISIKWVSANDLLPACLCLILSLMQLNCDTGKLIDFITKRIFDELPMKHVEWLYPPEMIAFGKIEWLTDWLTLSKGRKE